MNTIFEHSPFWIQNGAMAADFIYFNVNPHFLWWHFILRNILRALCSKFFFYKPTCFSWPLGADKLVINHTDSVTEINRYTTFGIGFPYVLLLLISTFIFSHENPIPKVYSLSVWFRSSYCAPKSYKWSSHTVYPAPPTQNSKTYLC